MGFSITNPAASNTTTVNPSKLVTKSNTAGEALVGSTAGTVSGTWYQVSASLSADTLVTQLHVITNGGFNAGAVHYVEIGYGGAGSEATLARVILRHSTITSTAFDGWGDLRIPVRVASGQRLAMRVVSASAIGSGATATVYVYGATYTNVEGN